MTCRHCVATHGVHCVSCDTSDIPEEGIRLEGEGPLPVDAGLAPDSSTAGQTFQSPIDSNRQSPLTDGAPGNGVRQQGASNNVHYYPQGSSRYTPEEPYNPEPYQGQYQDQGEYYDDPDYGTGYDQYDQYAAYDYNGYANRKRRSLFGKATKPVKVVISRNAATNTTLLKVVPILKNRPNGRWLYDLKNGDARMFVLNTHNPTLFSLSTARPMEVGKYIIAITGDYRRSANATTVDDRRQPLPTRRVPVDTLEGVTEEPLFEGVHLNLKVIVSVV